MLLALCRHNIPYQHLLRCLSFELCLYKIVLYNLQKLSAMAHSWHQVALVQVSILTCQPTSENNSDVTLS